MTSSAPTSSLRPRRSMSSLCALARPSQQAADLISFLSLRSAFLQFLSFMWNPLSWVMEGAALVAIALSNGGGRPPDWQDFVGIVLLLLVSAVLSPPALSRAENRPPTDLHLALARSTRPLVLSRSATPETPSRLSWTRSRPRPRSSGMASGPRLTCVAFSSSSCLCIGSPH